MCPTQYSTIMHWVNIYYGPEWGFIDQLGSRSAEKKVHTKEPWGMLLRHLPPLNHLWVCERKTSAFPKNLPSPALRRCGMLDFLFKKIGASWVPLKMTVRYPFKHADYGTSLPGYQVGALVSELATTTYLVTLVPCRKSFLCEIMCT